MFSNNCFRIVLNGLVLYGVVLYLYGIVVYLLCIVVMHRISLIALYGVALYRIDLLNITDGLIEIQPFPQNFNIFNFFYFAKVDSVHSVLLIVPAVSTILGDCHSSWAACSRVMFSPFNRILPIDFLVSVFKSTSKASSKTTDMNSSNP